MRLLATVNTEVFSQLVSVLSACGGEVVLHFSKTTLSLVVSQGINQIALWIGCSVQLCFSKYQVSSRNDDIITLKCNSKQLAQALTVDAAPTINMSLTRQGDTNTLQFDHRSNDSTKQLLQRVAVVLLSTRATEDYQEPEWGTPSVSVRFPQIRQVINWVNEMKDINQMVTLKATKEGEFKLYIESDSVTVETSFSGLEIVGETDQATMEEAEALVDLKKFKKVLKVGNLQGCTGEIHIFDKQMAKFNFIVPTNIPDQPTNLTYVLNASTKAV
ncbi:Hus1-like protein [Trichomonas vaginalis G3]|uniref:Checkpoint protein n=1 Tax=Trichomonas vaginalis (strain ATCC PRA-98 / G3) TaxID=412133 RepID=A2EXY8_TRIV3|nr:meiotic DNA integrity checkpoint [Trichomonas vaginalis G3]EAY02456.1 Hus1-like protein [Trichomonas vaginalis G3]KAI5511234.1 meiotic DNA integrity checkpoint [Trichomonas vaginalis G3]|eukprot:XP_001314695.1 Hus1-like protein [Trichomonas vaginalis G3]